MSSSATTTATTMAKVKAGKQQNHHHHHHHHSAAEDLAKVPSSGAWIIQLTLLANFSLATVKLVSSWVFKSKALEADAWHSFTDLAADVLALLAVVVGAYLKSSNMKQTSIKRAESLLALITSSVLVAAGCHLLWDSVTILRTQATGTHPSGHAELGLPSIQAIWPAALTLVVKEGLYRTAIKVANEIKSPVLASNAAHQRADGLLSIVTIIAILCSTVLENTAWIDSIGGLGISVIMLRAAVTSSIEAMSFLVSS